MPQLTWVGKDKVKNHHHDVPFRLLNTQYTFTAKEGMPANSTGNKIIHGDNLEALKSLLPEFEGKVNCIYIDPPYNTGNEGWVYNDNVNDPKIKKWLGQVVGKEGEDLSRHDKWLCMMYPRLKLLHRLLADDGVIFISIDDNEQAHLKLVMDEVFGAGNFVADVIWQHSIQGKNDAKSFSLHHNHTLVYRKSIKFTLGRVSRRDEHNISYSNPDNDPKGDWRSGDVRSPNYRENLKYIVKTPSGKQIEPPQNGWRWSEDVFWDKYASGEITFVSNETKVLRKIYLCEQGGRVPETIWFGVDVGTTREANNELKEFFSESPFDTPKPTRLIERVLQLATHKNAIILDSFAGSGTTAHAVLKQNAQDGGNRQFILIEMMDYAQTITAERVRRVMNGYGEGTKAVSGLGGNFDYISVGEPLFLDDGNLNEVVGEASIRQYVAYSERVTLDTSDTLQAVNPHCLGLKDDALFVFYYQVNAITALSMDFLATLAVNNLISRPNSYVIYADKCTLTPDIMQKYGITFKRIPRDITRF